MVNTFFINHIIYILDNEALERYKNMMNEEGVDHKLVHPPTSIVQILPKD